MKTLIISALIFLATSIANSAQLYLKNGNQISGDIKSQNEEEVILNILDVGSISFKVTEIEKIVENEYIPLDEVQNKTGLITGTIGAIKTNQTSTLSTDNKTKAIEHYKMAMKYYNTRNYDLAIEHFNKAVAYESTFAGDPQYMVREKIDSARKKKAEKERTYSESGSRDLMGIKTDPNFRTVPKSAPLPKTSPVRIKMDGTIDKD